VHIFDWLLASFAVDLLVTHLKLTERIAWRVDWRGRAGPFVVGLLMGLADDAQRAQMHKLVKMCVLSAFF
jgi:hypothetical protein